MHQKNIVKHLCMSWGGCYQAIQVQVGALNYYMWLKKDRRIDWLCWGKFTTRKKDETNLPVLKIIMSPKKKLSFSFSTTAEKVDQKEYEVQSVGYYCVLTRSPRIGLHPLSPWISRTSKSSAGLYLETWNCNGLLLEFWNLFVCTNARMLRRFPASLLQMDHAFTYSLVDALSSTRLAKYATHNFNLNISYYLLNCMYLCRYIYFERCCYCYQDFEYLLLSTIPKCTNSWFCPYDEDEMDDNVMRMEICRMSWMKQKHGQQACD